MNIITSGFIGTFAVLAPGLAAVVLEEPLILLAYIFHIIYIAKHRNDYRS